MVAYLEQRGVKVKRTGKDKDTVKTLWQKVKQIKINEPMYDIDQALKEKGIEVLRLPPYHPEVGHSLCPSHNLYHYITHCHCHVIVTHFR